MADPTGQARRVAFLAFQVTDLQGVRLKLRLANSPKGRAYIGKNRDVTTD
jgi:hypothetical protein